MSFHFRLALEGNLNDYARQIHLRIARGARVAAEKHAARSKLALREDARRGGLGERIANAWRADIYPKSASVRTHAPAVLVYSNAPKIVGAFGQASIITARNALYMAIPTENTPRRGRRYVSPAEVEAIFNQDLIFIAGRGQQILAFVDAVKSRNGKKYRRASKVRTERQRRKVEMVLMFVMVRQVHLRKRLDWQRIFVDLEEDWADLFPSEVERAINEGAA